MPVVWIAVIKGTPRSHRQRQKKKNANKKELSENCRLDNNRDSRYRHEAQPLTLLFSLRRGDDEKILFKHPQSEYQAQAPNNIKLERFSLCCKHPRPQALKPSNDTIQRNTSASITNRPPIPVGGHRLLVLQSVLWRIVCEQCNEKLE